jgi:transposase
MSRHRFDHSVDRSDDTKEVSASARPRRIELITGVERRRKWSVQEKVEIIAESLVEGAVVSEVARRHGLSPQQLFGWRARLRDAVRGSS